MMATIPDEDGIIQCIDSSSNKRPRFAIERINEHGSVKTRQRKQSNQQNLSILQEKFQLLSEKKTNTSANLMSLLSVNP
jgi:hypothetical protein